MASLEFDPWPPALGIYLDYNATTPVAKNVQKAMQPYWSLYFANAASMHVWGKFSFDAVENSRQKIAQCLQVSPQEIYFTSGATEALNIAIQGLCAAYPHKNHLISAATEHKAVLDTCAALQARGIQITILPVDSQGQVDPDVLRKAIRPQTLAIILMAANNETGVLHPLDKIIPIAQENGIFFVCDATQAIGKIPFTLQNIDIAAFSAHKFYGPKGIGVLYIRRRPRVKVLPLIYGGGHENGLRSGTLNVPAIVGMAAALEGVLADLETEALRQKNLRDTLQKALLDLPGAWVNGLQAPRLPNTLSIGFENVPAKNLLHALPQLALATGSACTSARQEPSHVLQAMGLSLEKARSVIRISLGRPTTFDEIQKAITEICDAVHRIRSKPYG